MNSWLPAFVLVGLAVVGAIVFIRRKRRAELRQRFRLYKGPLL